MAAVSACAFILSVFSPSNVFCCQVDEQSLVYELTPEVSFSPGDALREKRQLSLTIYVLITCSR